MDTIRMIRYETLTIAHYELFRKLLDETEGVSNRAADSRESIARYLARNQGLSRAAFAGDVMVGCALCGHDGRRGYLQHVMVKPEYRKQGIAKELVDRCLDGLAHLGILKTHIDVFIQNRTANSYWARNGWQLRDDINRYSYNRSADPNI